MSAPVRRKPPEIAYSWPFGLLVLCVFVFLPMWEFAGWQWARWTAGALLLGAFAMCPVRDAMLPRFCGHPEGRPCSWCGAASDPDARP